MVVHPAVGNRSGTLVNAMLGHSELSDINGEFRPGIVHRLDKNTTGALVIAKTNFAHNNIAKQIQDRETKKIYIALVKGIIKEQFNRLNINRPKGYRLSFKDKLRILILRFCPCLFAIIKHKS